MFLNGLAADAGASDRHALLGDDRNLLANRVRHLLANLLADASGAGNLLAHLAVVRHLASASLIRALRPDKVWEAARLARAAARARIEARLALAAEFPTATALDAV